MAIVRAVCFLFLTCAFVSWASAQDAPPLHPLASSSTAVSADDNKLVPVAPVSSPAETVPLIVPKGMAIQVALDREVRIRKAGQSISGHVVEPVYAFDKLVVPVGTTVTGQITKIDDVSKGKSTLDALNAEFSPARGIDVEFS